MYINGDGKWVNLLKDAIITYNNNKHSTINVTPVDNSNNPEKLRYLRMVFTFIFPSQLNSFNDTYIFSKAARKKKVADFVRNAYKRNILIKGYTSDWIRKFFKNNQVLKEEPPTSLIRHINGDIMGVK